jgi:bidirectional [NiFe] hydrogenase diaphorase subunit
MTAQAKPAAGKAADAHPSGDHRFKMLDATMKRLKYQPDALIEVLHNAQELFGFLKEDLLMYVARGLKLPPSRVFGVATFYHLFTFAPKGEHACTVCTGTACFVKGANALVDEVTRATGARPGRTTADGRFSLDVARCLGSCGIAPIVVFDGQVCGNQTPETVRHHLDAWVTYGPR